MVNKTLIDYSKTYGISEREVLNCFGEAQQKIYSDAVIKNQTSMFMIPDKTLDNLCLELTKQELEKIKN